MTMMMNNAQEEEELEIPTAYRFSPTDKELITFYLRRKVDGQPLPRFTPIVEKNLYGSDQPSPWEIFRGITRTSTSADEDFDFYFFTLVKKKFGKGKTIERKIATGTWRIQNNNPVYDNNGDEDSTEKKKKKKKIKSSSSGLTTLGHLKTLNYIQGSIEEQEKQQQGCSLIMHEYSLIEYPKHQTENWVLCRLRMGKPPTTPKRPIGMEENDQLCEPPNKRSKSSSPSSVSSVTTAATSTCEHGEGLLLQQSQSCSDNIDDHLWDTSLDYEACQAILDDDVYASLLNQLPDPKLCATSNATTTTSTWSSNLIQSDVLPDMPQPIQEPPSQYQLCAYYSSGTTSCPSACPTGTQSEISVPISEVSDMWLPIQEPPSHQPQLEYEKFPEYLAEQDGYTLDDIWDDSFSY